MAPGAGWKAALLVALSPGLILAAFVNWDLFAMALAAGGLAAWAARDLDAIMACYSETVDFTAPTVVTRWGRAGAEPSGSAGS